VLRGLSVLVTRPSPQGEKLCQQIEAQGGRAIHFPTIAFAPPQDADAYLRAIDQLGEQEWLIFISPQAVQACVPDLRRRWPVLPPMVKFAAVGGGTAAALREAGYLAALLPEQEWNSEGLLALREFQSVAEMKIAIIRGEGGREMIDKKLMERGAKVLPVLVYRRILPDIDVAAFLQRMHEQSLSAIICTSGEAVRNLKILLGEAAWKLISDVDVIVMSDRVKLLAQDLGFQRIWVASKASNDAILDVLANIREIR
jgi:uroporphyrinogen-III synthase